MLYYNKQETFIIIFICNNNFLSRKNITFLFVYMKKTKFLNYTRTYDILFSE